jgi:hypothetical protein
MMERSGAASISDNECLACLGIAILKSVDSNFKGRISERSFDTVIIISRRYLSQKAIRNEAS